MLVVSYSSTCQQLSSTSMAAQPYSMLKQHGACPLDRLLHVVQQVDSPVNQAIGIQLRG
jgi:hypothetical protein